MSNVASDVVCEPCGDICDRSLKWSKVDPNFALSWPQLFFGGRAPKLWDLTYQIQELSDHLAKFRGDRPAELGDLGETKKNISSKTRPLGTTVPGGLFNIVNK